MKKRATYSSRKQKLRLFAEPIHTFSELREIAENRLVFIRNMIDLFHTYGHDPELFLRHFKGNICIENVKKKAIVDFEREFRFLIQNTSLTDVEIELYCLHSCGFTCRELRTIYGHTNKESIYVLMNRARTKLKQFAKHHREIVKLEGDAPVARL